MITRVILLFLIVGLIGGVGASVFPPSEVTANGLTPVWQPLIPTNNAPPARREAALVYDKARNRVILFGGRNANTRFNDTWAFNLATLTWQELVPEGATRPQIRSSMVAGLDVNRNRLLITTGEGSSGFFNDVWAFDLLTHTWNEIIVSGSKPAQRYGSAGAVVGNQLMVTHGFTTSGRYDDTWVFQLNTNRWQNITPSGGKPWPRCLHTAAAAGNSLIIFGGCASGYGPCPLNDTWVFHNGSWLEIDEGTRPQARTFPSLARTHQADQLLLFGGSTDMPVNDLWLLNTNTGWTELNPDGPLPQPRRGHNAVWIDGFTGTSGDGLMLIYGGRGANQTHLSDLWLLLPHGAIAPEQINLNGPSHGEPGQSLSFTASVQPSLATVPLTYTWQADDHTPIIHTTGLMDTVDFVWNTSGTRNLTLTVSNAAGQRVVSQTVLIFQPTDFSYLPLVLRP